MEVLVIHIVFLIYYIRGINQSVCVLTILMKFFDLLTLNTNPTPTLTLTLTLTIF